MPVFQKLDRPRTFFARLEIMSRESEITATFKIVEELRALAAAADAADAAQKQALQRGDAPMGQAENVAPEDPSLLAELLQLACGEEPRVGLDGIADAAGAERRRALIKRLASTLSKRVRQRA